MTLTDPTLLRINKRLSTDEFRAEVKSKGWTYRALGERWGFTESWVSKVARRNDRAAHWDDAVRGLPTILRGQKV